MQNDQVSVSGSEEQAISQRTQQLVNYLETLWQSPQEPIAEVLKRITSFIVHLPEPYQSMGMTKIAEYLASSMGLHFLDIMATFKRKASEEGTSLEEYVQTVQGVLPELFTEIMGISRLIHIRSLEDLITLSNITVSLYNLSRADSADEAQSWMYELPILYWNQLSQEHLAANIQVQSIVTTNSTTTTRKGYIAWNSSLPQPVEVTTDTNKSIQAIA
jgi:hypothetical protein